MTGETTAGDDARTATDAPPTQKSDAAVLGRGETHIPDDDAVLLTDGGVDTADELEHDPRAFSPSLTPAVVYEVHKDDSVSKVSFANVQLRECGALYWEEWSGATGLLPEWRWSEVRYLETDRVERDGTKLQPRIAADDWDRLPDVVCELVDQEDDADEPELVSDGGYRPGHTLSTTAVSDPDAEAESSARANGGGTRVPELPGFERDILLTLARLQPTNGRGLLADLSTLRDEEILAARLYPHLNELADSGLVEKRENYHDERSHEYRLAEAGRHTLREHSQRVQDAVEALEEGDR